MKSNILVLLVITTFFLYTSCRKEKPHLPEENRFATVVLAEKLNEPLEISILPNGNVLFIERFGAIKIYDQNEQTTKLVDSIAIRHGYLDTNNKRHETDEGMYGMQVDPNFEKNNFVYFYYAPADNSSMNTLVRYELRNEKLVRESKKVILEVHVEPELGGHSGGSIDFDGHGNLYLSTGDDTKSGDEAEYSPADERPGRSIFDAQRTAGNTNDLRGHILRIHPEPDGSYTIPTGNLFPKGMASTRPEIYAMGNRNPHRISVDKKTGYLYWGNVGPDASKDSVTFGPMGYDELEQAKKAGNFGWPYFTGGNQPYVDYDFVTHKSGKKYDPVKPLNQSPNNSGLTELPPVSPPFIWYPHAESKEFPLVGSGGQLVMAGPVFYTEDFKTASRPFPDYYNGKLLIYDFVRSWIMAVTMDKDGNYASMEPFMGSHKFNSPIDMAFGKDGDLYLLQYGRGEPEASLVRIEYTAGNRKPEAKIASEKLAGAVPFTAHFSSKGTVDFDGDAIIYNWNVLAPDGKLFKTFNTPDMDFSFEKPGVYKVELTVNDGNGGESTTTTQIMAGNEPPRVEFSITRGNTSLFFAGHTFDYKVNVSDREDGSVESGSILSNEVQVTIEYLPQGYDKKMMELGNMSANDISAYSIGKSLMEKSDCKACHTLDKKTIGPALIDVARKYENDPKASHYLLKKIKEGGSGVWGETVMAAHPSMPNQAVTEMVRYILGLTQKPVKSLPLQGSYTTKIPKGQNGQGVFVLRAAYTDRGGNSIPGIHSEQVILLRNANTPAAACDDLKDIQKYSEVEPPIDWMIAQKNGAYLVYKGIDLNNINGIAMMGTAPTEWGMVGGVVEVRLGSPGGELIGTSASIEAKPMNIPSGEPVPVEFSAPIKPKSGRYDLYLVCKNNKAGSGRDLFMLMQVRFINELP